MIFLLRHAETLWNSQFRKQGLDDSSLTTLGHRQAAAYGQAIKQFLQKHQIPLEQVSMSVSPLGRALSTADYVVKAIGLPEESMVVEPRLIEFDYGRWSGLTNGDIEQQFPGELENRNRQKWFYTVAGGESYVEVELRVDSWLAELDPKKTCIAVTHNAVSRVLRCRYCDIRRTKAERLEHRQHLIYLLGRSNIDVIDVSPFMESNQAG